MVDNVEGFVREWQVLLQVPLPNGWAGGMEVEVHPIGVKSFATAKVQMPVYHSF